MQPRGDFSGLKFNDTEMYGLNRAYSMITSLNKWELLARRDVPGDCGFVNPSHADVEVVEFLNAMKMLGIEPFGFIMRQMEFIAKKGWCMFIVERRDS